MTTSPKRSLISIPHFLREYNKQIKNVKNSDQRKQQVTEDSLIGSIKQLQFNEQQERSPNTAANHDDSSVENNHEKSHDPQDQDSIDDSCEHGSSDEFPSHKDNLYDEYEQDDDYDDKSPHHASLYHYPEWNNYSPGDFLGGF